MIQKDNSVSYVNAIQLIFLLMLNIENIISKIKYDND